MRKGRKVCPVPMVQPVRKCRRICPAPIRKGRKVFQVRMAQQCAKTAGFARNVLRAEAVKRLGVIAKNPIFFKKLIIYFLETRQRHATKTRPADAHPTSAHYAPAPFFGHRPAATDGPPLPARHHHDERHTAARRYGYNHLARPLKTHSASHAALLKCTRPKSPPSPHPANLMQPLYLAIYLSGCNP